MDDTSDNGQVDNLANDPAADELERMRAEMSQTRAAMSVKVEAMEDKVLQSVKKAQVIVEDTVSNVKGQVEDTVDTVKQTLDVRYQTRQHPWLMVGASVAVGFTAGSLLSRRSGNGHAKAEDTTSRLEARPYSGERREVSVREPDEPKKPGAVKQLFGRLMARFGDEIETVESAAIGAMMGLARDWLSKELPSLAPQLKRAMDSATSKLGGEPIPSSQLHRDGSEEVLPRNPR